MEHSKKKGLIIGLAIVLLLAIGAAAVVFLLPKKADENHFVSKISPNGVNATITASYQYDGGEETYFTDITGNTELVLTPDIVSSKELSAPIEIKLVEDKSYIIFTFAFTNNNENSGMSADSGIIVSLEDTSAVANAIVKYAARTSKGADITDKYVALITASDSAPSSIYVEPEQTKYVQILVERDNGDATYLSNATAGLMWTLQVSSHYEKNGWVISDGNVATAYVGEEADVTIPDTVTSIGPDMLRDNNVITSITIPSEVTSIGAQAFSGCATLTSVIFEDPNWAIDKTINGEVVREAVLDLTNAQSNASFVKGEGANYSWSKTTTSGDYILDEDDTIIAYTGTDTDLRLPMAATSVKIGLFENNTAITSVDINSKMVTTGKSVFKNCTSLEKVTFRGKSKLTTISNNAFEGCTSLQTIALPSSLTAINADAFKNSALNSLQLTQAQAKKSSITNALSGVNLAEVRIPVSDGYLGFKNFADAKEAEIPETIYYGSNTLPTSIISLMVPTGDSYLPEDYFYNCYNLNQIINKSTYMVALSTSLSSMGQKYSYVYEICNGDNEPLGSFSTQNDCTLFTYGVETILTSYNGSAANFTIPSNVTSIGKYAFKDNDTLQQVTIPSNVKSIDNYAFSGCSELTSVTFEDKNNWYHCTNIQCTELDALNDAETNATYLTSTYVKKRIIKNTDNKFMICAGTLCAYIGNDTEVVIPHTVTSIGYDCFYANDFVTQVTIPNTVRCMNFSFYNAIALQTVLFEENSILENICFRGCISLSNIVLPNSLRRMDDGSFENCTSLTSIVVPSGVSKISQYAFRSCNNLKNITISNGVTAIGEGAFYECTSLESIVIPKTITSFGKSAFYNCSSLATLTFEEGIDLYSINQNCFCGCTSLTSVTIPKSVSTIDKSAFQSCAKLSEVLFEEGSNLFTLESGAFTACYSLTTITLPSRLYTFKSDAFNGCYNLVQMICKSRSVILNTSSSGNARYAYEICNYDTEPTGVFSTVDGFRLFTYGDDIVVVGYNGTASNIVLSKNITAIGGYIFGDNNTIKTFRLEEDSKLKSIGYGAFSECRSLESLDLSNTQLLTTIENYSFSSCRNLASVTIPSSIEQYGLKSYSFSGCSNLVQVINLSTAITLSKGNTNNGCIALYAYEVCNSSDIPQGVFSTKNGLRLFTYGSDVILVGLAEIQSTMTIPKEVTKMGAYIFENQTGLESVIFEEDCSLTNIGGSAFAGCTSLSSITIPNGVKTIDAEAFYGCTALTSITISSSVETIDANAFVDCALLQEVIFESGSQLKTIAGGAFKNCEALSAFVMPSGVTTIGNRAFEGCALTSFTIVSSVTKIGYRAFYGCSSLASVTFESPTNWRYSQNDYDTVSPKPTLYEIDADLSDAVVAAEYLTSTRCPYYWKRLV